MCERMDRPLDGLPEDVMPPSPIVGGDIKIIASRVSDRKS